jgi:hypothetical protein
MKITTEPVLVNQGDEGATLTVDSGSPVIYRLARQAPELGTLSAGQSAVLTAPTWVATAAGSAEVSVTPLAVATTDNSESLTDTVQIGTVSITKVSLIKPVMFPIRVQAVSCILDNTALAASDTNYWTAEVGKLAALTGVFGSVMATKSTQATGGAAFLTQQAWTFDAITFSAANQLLVKDDVLAIRWTKFGTPANLQGLMVGIRWTAA